MDKIIMTDSKLKLTDHDPNYVRIEICKKFIQSTTRPKYLLGRNMYAKGVVRHVNINGFIDDFTTDRSYLEKPIIKAEDVPADALVLIIAGGRPLTAEKRLKDLGLEYLDYFSFYRYSGLPLDDIHFLEGFIGDLTDNREKYDWIYGELEDEVSKEQFKKLLEFKRSYNLDYLRGFEDLEDKQYFENFLELDREGEVFADVGSYDGYTSEAFANKCPGFAEIHVFEPIPENMTSVKERLIRFKNVYFHPLGLSDRRQILRFSVGGSTSTTSLDGTEIVELDKMDNILDGNVTFIKIDIEGAEIEAIEGAKETIEKYHPKLAISVYHKPCDIWMIPEKILSIRTDYKIYLRHYTESIYETVMFFVPTPTKASTALKNGYE